MPSNKQQRAEQECRRNLDLVLRKALPASGQMLFSDVILQAILSYSVSPVMVKKFVMDFYVEPGYIELKDGVLYPVKKGESA